MTGAPRPARNPLTAPVTSLPRPAEDAALDPEAMRQPLGNAWYCVGQSRSLGRTGLRAVELNGEQIVLGRTPDGTPFALRDRCPHKHGRLSQGIVHGGAVACPLHNWRISLSTGEALGEDKGCTPVVPVRISGGRVLICRASTLKAAA